MSDMLNNILITILFIYIILYIHGIDLIQSIKNIHKRCRACGRINCGCSTCSNCTGNCSCSRNRRFEGFEVLQNGISDVWVQGDTAPQFPIQQNPFLQDNSQYCSTLCGTNWNENYILSNNISTQNCIIKCLSKK